MHSGHPATVLVHIRTDMGQIRHNFVLELRLSWRVVVGHNIVLVTFDIDSESHLPDRIVVLGPYMADLVADMNHTLTLQSLG